MTVAIVMRTRGRPLFLDRALASVAGQTYTDYELIVVNDGGDPANVEESVARRPLPEPARARITHHPVPVGLRSPPNAPIRETDSTYVVIHDDDDTWDPRFLAETTRRLEETGAMGVVATTDKVVEQVDEDRITTIARTRLHPQVEHINLYAMCFENHATPIAFLYRREAYDTVGGYDEELETVADWDFALRMLSRFDIEFLGAADALAFYHHRPGAAEEDTNVVYGARHRQLENLLANRYLREDFVSGRPGLGLVMNALRYEYASRESLFGREKEAIDERIEYLADCIRKVDDRVTDLQRALTPAERLRSDLRFIRTLPRRAFGRLGRS